MYPYSMAIHFNTSLPLAQYSYWVLVIVYVFRFLILEIYRMPYVVQLINARLESLRMYVTVS